jgi:hypothetical protein
VSDHCPRFRRIKRLVLAVAVTLCALVVGAQAALATAPPTPYVALGDSYTVGSGIRRSRSSSPSPVLLSRVLLKRFKLGRHPGRLAAGALASCRGPRELAGHAVVGTFQAPESALCVGSLLGV